MDKLKTIRDTVNHIYLSLLLQGLAFIALAVLLVLYPFILVWLVSATCIFIGILLIIMAAKVRAFWDKMPNILK